MVVLWKATVNVQISPWDPHPCQDLQTTDLMLGQWMLNKKSSISSTTSIPRLSGRMKKITLKKKKAAEWDQTVQNTLFLPLVCCNFACCWAPWRGVHVWSAGSWVGRGAPPAPWTHPGCSCHKTDFQTERNITKRSEKRRPQATGAVSSRLMDNEISNRRKDLSVNNFVFLHTHGFLSHRDGGWERTDHRHIKCWSPETNLHCSITRRSVGGKMQPGSPRSTYRKGEDKRACFASLRKRSFNAHYAHEVKFYPAK